jgi:hypothetical protein
MISGESCLFVYLSWACRAHDRQGCSHLPLSIGHDHPLAAFKILPLKSRFPKIFYFDY